jgi:hypothetical protein
VSSQPMELPFALNCPLPTHTSPSRCLALVVLLVSSDLPNACGAAGEGMYSHKVARVCAAAVVAGVSCLSRAPCCYLLCGRVLVSGCGGCTLSQLAEVVFRGCWDGRLGAFRMVPAGSPHLPGWLGHWRYAPLALQVPLAELPTTAPDIGPPDGGWWARARGARRHPPGPARRLLVPRPAPFRLVWPGGRMRAACAGCR